VNVSSIPLAPEVDSASARNVVRVHLPPVSGRGEIALQGCANWGMTYVNKGRGVG